MGRRRKAWLENGTGIRIKAGKRAPGFYVRWHEYTADGQRRTPSKSFTIKRDAEKFVRRHNAKHELGLLDELMPITIEEAARMFFATRTLLARKSRCDYATAIGCLHAIVADLPLAEITGAHIDLLISQRLAKSTEATVAKHLRSLRTLFNWAIKEGYARRNPIADAGARPADIHLRERPTITEQQLAGVIAHLDTEDRRLAVWLAMTTGLDRGVIEDLCSAQIDKVERCIRIQRPKTRKQKKPKRLVIPIHEQLAPLLFAKLSTSEPYQPLLSGLSRQKANRDWWKIATAAAGCPQLWFRDLRAVFSSVGQRIGGLTLSQVQRQLGHSSPAVTSAHYEMPDPDIQRRVDSLHLPGFGQTPSGSTAKPEDPLCDATPLPSGSQPDAPD